jgi:hypothetical protein
MDMAGRHYADFTHAERQAVLAACPRSDDFGQQVIALFYQGLKHRPASTFGTFNDDFIAFNDPEFKRANLCTIILQSPWR